MDLNALNAVTIAATPEDPGDPTDPKIKIKDSKKLKSGDYSKKHIEGIIKASKEIGVDPYQAISLALQESGIGTAKEKWGRGHRTKKQPTLAAINDWEEYQQKELDEKLKSTGIEEQYLKLAIVLRDKIKYAKQLGFKDEASQLQAYNGYGILTKDKLGGANKAYGVEVGEGINMKKNPLYGKRLLELKADIAGNPEIKKLVDTYSAQKPVAVVNTYIQKEKLNKTAQETYKNTQALTKNNL
jgi:hypothetical protein